MGKQNKRASVPGREQARLKYCFMLRMRVADGIVGIGKILAVVVPIGIAFGGRTTVLSASLITKFSITLCVGSVAAVIMVWAKMTQQKKELVRCRDRIKELEKLLSRGRDAEKEQ